MSKSKMTLYDIKKTPVLRLRYITVTQLFIFIIWPFGQMINTVRNFRKPNFMSLLWLFCVYYGLVFVYVDPFGNAVGDATVYANRLIEMHSHPFSFNTLYTSFYSDESTTIDIYQPLLTWLFSLVTGNPSFLFGAFSAVFGFFYVKNLWIVFSRISVKVGVILFLYMLSYALVNPIWNINGVRFWTAAQVFIYGNLLYFLYKDKRGLLWSASTLFFHFSFMFPVALLMLWVFLPRKSWLAMALFSFYIGTSLISEINLLGVKNLLSFLPNAFQGRVSSYTDATYARNIDISRQEYNSTFALAANVAKWIVYVWVSAVFLKKKQWMRNHETYFNLFLFALFLGGFSNLASNVPSGARFVVVSNTLFYALFVLLLGRNYLQIYWLKLITYPIIFFVLFYTIRVGLETMGILIIAGNPVLAIFSGAQTPVIAFLKSLF